MTGSSTSRSPYSCKLNIWQNHAKPMNISPMSKKIIENCAGSALRTAELPRLHCHPWVPSFGLLGLFNAINIWTYTRIPPYSNHSKDASGLGGKSETNFPCKLATISVCWRRAIVMLGLLRAIYIFGIIRGHKVQNMLGLRNSSDDPTPTSALKRCEADQLCTWRQPTHQLTPSMDPYNQRKGTRAKHQVGMGQDIYEIIILTSYFRVHMVPGCTRGLNP